MKNYLDILKLNLKLNYIFQEAIIQTYHWQNNLKEMIGSNNILNDKVIHKKPIIKSTKFCQTHNIKNNLCRKHLISNNSFTCFTTKNNFKNLPQI